jgi:hypothetical protein
MASTARKKIAYSTVGNSILQKLSVRGTPALPIQKVACVKQT